MTLHVEVGKDCSTQQLVKMESFHSTEIPEAKEFRSKKKSKAASISPTNSTLPLLSDITQLSEAPKSKAASISPTNSTLPLLSDITQLSEAPQCGEGKIYKIDHVIGGGNIYDSNQWNKIPKIIHQTSRSRCLTPAFNKYTTKWSDWHKHGWSYYFHDDEAIQRMFELNYEIFPSLKDVVENCLVSGTAKADLWRYLVLFHYGGIYSDLDTTPNNLKPDTFSSMATEASELEAFFAIEVYHFLSQYFFAIAPRHPLMHHTILETLHKLLAANDTVAFDASLVTGPKALHRGLLHFFEDAGIKPEKNRKGFGKGFRHKYIVANTTIIGTANYTIGAYGDSTQPDLWVWRYDSDLSAGIKKDGYAAMGMEHFGKFKKRPSGVSCLEAIKVSGNKRYKSTLRDES